MQWAALGIVVIALILMSTRHPKTAFSLLGGLGIAGVLIIFITQDDARQARFKLPVADIHIQNPVMIAAYGDSYQFNARLANANRAILLKEFVVSITMLDCGGDSDGVDSVVDLADSAADLAADSADSADACAVIGQTEKRFTTEIPPGQARDISRNLVFYRATPAGQVRWRYRITETRS